MKYLWALMWIVWNAAGPALAEEKSSVGYWHSLYVNTPEGMYWSILARTSARQEGQVKFAEAFYRGYCARKDDPKTVKPALLVTNPATGKFWILTDVAKEDFQDASGTG